MYEVFCMPYSVCYAVLLQQYTKWHSLEVELGKREFSIGVWGYDYMRKMKTA